MLKQLGMILLLGGIGALVAPQGALASCTASFTCSNACHESLECNPSGVVISCSAPNKTVSCSGSTSCTVGTNAVTCDGTTTVCQTAASRCAIDSVSIRCDATFKACPTCGGKVCQSLPPADPGFWSAPAAPETAPAEASRCF